MLLQIFQHEKGSQDTRNMNIQVKLSVLVKNVYSYRLVIDIQQQSIQQKNEKKKHTIGISHNWCQSDIYFIKLRF